MDAEAFDEFYAASFARLVGQVYALVGDRDEAQECVQERTVLGDDAPKQTEGARRA